MPARPSERFASRAEKELRRELLVSPLPELGLVAANGPNDPEPELVVESDEPTFSAAQRRAAIEARARVDQPTVHSERLRQQEMQQQLSAGAPTQEVGTC